MKKIYSLLFVFFGLIINAQVFWQGITPAQPAGFPYRSGLYTAGKNDVVYFSYSDGSIPFSIPTGLSFSISPDGGQTWTTKGYFPYNLMSTDHNNFSFTGFEALSTSTSLILGVEGTSLNPNSKVFKTKDGGVTWQQTGTFTTYAMNVYFFDNNNGIVVCTQDSSNKFKIYTTGNGGDSWQPVNSGNIPSVIGIEGISATSKLSSGNKNSFWFGTTSGRIFKTDDKGFTWSAINTPYEADQIPQNPAGNLGQFTIDDVNSNIAYILEYYSGKLHKTTDGGINWVAMGNIGMSSTNLGIVKVPNSDYLVVTGNKSRYSTDEAATWIDIDSNYKFGLSSSGPKTTFAVLDNIAGFFYKLNGIPTKNIVDEGPAVENNEDTFGIYPIPTGNYLYIKSKILIDGYTIWDSAGRFIQQGKSSDNSINVAWLLKGTYHIEIHHNGNVIVKKFIKK